jgi:uncharacterized protein YdbL (DUF1318 family)
MNNHQLSSALLICTFLSVLSINSFAQTDEVAAPEITNPAIRKIIQSRVARVTELNNYKVLGYLGENNKAIVEILRSDAIPLQERAVVQELIRAENADRERMFEEIADATGMDLSHLPRIRETYAITLRENALTGDWIQMPDGSWKQK